MLVDELEDGPERPLVPSLLFVVVLIIIVSVIAIVVVPGFAVVLLKLHVVLVDAVIGQMDVHIV